MTIPVSQFYLFFMDDDAFFYQTYEEALKRVCEFVKSAEFIDLTPDNSSDVSLYFPKVNRKKTIHCKLFTYDGKIPLVTNRDYKEQNRQYHDCRNLLI